jgi:chromosome segregation ATPase
MSNPIQQISNPQTIEEWLISIHSQAEQLQNQLEENEQKINCNQRILTSMQNTLWGLSEDVQKLNNDTDTIAKTLQQIAPSFSTLNLLKIAGKTALVAQTILL